LRSSREDAGASGGGRTESVLRSDRSADRPGAPAVSSIPTYKGRLGPTR
jgi:hypothetical protein